MKLYKNIKEKFNIWKRYLKEAPDNISKYKEWKDVIDSEYEFYNSAFNKLGLHSNADRTVLWQYLNLSEAEERYWDYFAKNNKLMGLIQPTVKYLQDDLKWGEYLTYDIAHVENSENPEEVIMTYVAIFKFTPVPLIEEDTDYNQYVKKYKKIKRAINFLIGGALILLGSGIACWCLMNNGII